ncbi:hypothetical protein HCH54_004226 [Aspergillus fumigatus]
MNELWLLLHRCNAWPNLLNETCQVRFQDLGSLKRRKMTALNEKVSGMDLNGNQGSYLLVISEEDQISCCGHPGSRSRIKFHGKIGISKWFVYEPPCTQFGGELSVRKVLFDLFISIPAGS